MTHFRAIFLEADQVMHDGPELVTYDLSAADLEGAASEARNLPAPKGANLIKIYRPDDGGRVEKKIWLPFNA